MTYWQLFWLAVRWAVEVLIAFGIGYLIGQRIGRLAVLRERARRR